MANETEASCLLRTGSLYPLRIGFRSRVHGEIFLGVKSGAFSIVCDDAPIIHFDLEGRWQRAFFEGVHYLKGLDTRTFSITRVREGESLRLVRRPLSFAETSDLDEQIRVLVLELRGTFTSETSRVLPPDPLIPLGDEDAIDRLDTALRWDSARWFSQRERYVETYGPIGFLPAELVNPLILQATLGQISQRGFGSGSAVDYHDRTPTDFAEHCRRVVRLFGRRLQQTRQIFLGGPDLFRRPVGRVLGELRSISEVFELVSTKSRLRASVLDVPGEVAQFEQVAAFLHQYDTDPYPNEAWQNLSSKGMRRVNFGIETGSPTILESLGRAWKPDDFTRWVANVPSDVRLGVTVLIGSGGAGAERDHVESTCRLVESAQLPSGTLVSLVDVAELAEDGPVSVPWVPLSPGSTKVQGDEFKSRLTLSLAGQDVKVASYSTDKRWR